LRARVLLQKRERETLLAGSVRERRRRRSDGASTTSRGECPPLSSRGMCHRGANSLKACSTFYLFILIFGRTSGLPPSASNGTGAKGLTIVRRDAGLPPFALDAEEGWREGRRDSLARLLMKAETSSSLYSGPPFVHGVRSRLARYCTVCKPPQKSYKQLAASARLMSLPLRRGKTGRGRLFKWCSTWPYARRECTCKLTQARAPSRGGASLPEGSSCSPTRLPPSLLVLPLILLRLCPRLFILLPTSQLPLPLCSVPASTRSLSCSRSWAAHHPHRRRPTARSRPS
jgi:hypothetical protein